MIWTSSFFTTQGSARQTVQPKEAGATCAPPLCWRWTLPNHPRSIGHSATVVFLLLRPPGIPPHTPPAPHIFSEKMYWTSCNQQPCRLHPVNCHGRICALILRKERNHVWKQESKWKETIPQFIRKKLGETVTQLKPQNPAKKCPRKLTQSAKLQLVLAHSPSFMFCCCCRTIFCIAYQQHSSLGICFGFSSIMLSSCTMFSQSCIVTMPPSAWWHPRTKFPLETG